MVKEGRRVSAFGGVLRQVAVVRAVPNRHSIDRGCRVMRCNCIFTGSRLANAIYFAEESHFIGRKRGRVVQQTLELYKLDGEPN